MRIVGLKIQGGYTSEARVFASLLGHRKGQYDPLVIHHQWPGNREGTRQFEIDAGAQLARLDVGLRPQRDSRYRAAARLVLLLRFKATFPSLLKIARTYDPDVIYSSQQLWDCAAASHVAKRLKKPHVMHLHFPVGPWLQTGFSSSPRLLTLAMAALRLENPLDRLLTCSHVVAVSDFIRGEAVRHGVSPDRVTTVRNSIQLPAAPPPDTRHAVRAELGLPPDAPVIGIVGRLDADKGHADTLAAFGRCMATHPDARLLVVGDGSLQPALVAEAGRMGLADRVMFTGHRPDVPRLLAAMDIFSHPSRREAFGLAVGEASAAGLPVIAYEEGATPELVAHGETGLLAPPGDIAALAASFRRLLDRPDEARQMGAAGRRRMAEAFRPEDAARAFARVLQRLVH